CAKQHACTPADMTTRVPGVAEDGKKKPDPACNADRPDRQNQPINCVDWEQATAFCRSLGKRLPSEEEWKYAAVGGAEHRDYAWGRAEPTNQLCWSGRPWKDKAATREGTCPVGSFERGAFGLADMAGNVREWTSTALGDEKAIRGGGYDELDVAAGQSQIR